MKKCMIAAITAACSISALAAERPNILYIMSDDHTTQGFGCYGSRLAELNPTPTLDSLASEGMRFDRVFCHNAICTPSRANIMTGQYSQSNGVQDLDGILPTEKQYLALEMKKAGYQTAVIGKWHLHTDPDSFDYYCVFPGQGKYYNPEMYTNVGGTPKVMRLTSKIKAKTRNVRKFDGMHSSDAVADVALEWFKDVRKKDQPFMLMMQFKAPHDMFGNAKRYDSYLEDVFIPEPENLYDQPAEGAGSIATRGVNDELVHVIGSSVSKRTPHRNMGQHMKVDQSLPDREYTKVTYQRYLKKYLRCVKGVDDNVKRVLDYMEKEGLLDNTVIIYTGDQGFMLGEHDYIDKRWMYEEALRMPFIVRYPKMVQAGSTNDWIINNTDFAPTMLDLAGVKTPDYMQGHSFVGALQGHEKPEDWRKSSYYRYWMHMAHKHNNPAHFGIRSDRYKLIFFYGTDYEKKNGKNRAFPDTPAGWEFYDLERDAAEMHNEYSNPEYRPVIERMKKELIATRKDLNEEDEKYPQIQKIIEAHWND